MGRMFPDMEDNNFRIRVKLFSGVQPGVQLEVSGLGSRVSGLMSQVSGFGPWASLGCPWDSLGSSEVFMGSAGCPWGVGPAAQQF